MIRFIFCLLLLLLNCNHYFILSMNVNNLIKDTVFTPKCFTMVEKQSNNCYAQGWTLAPAHPLFMMGRSSLISTSLAGRHLFCSPKVNQITVMSRFKTILG